MATRVATYRKSVTSDADLTLKARTYRRIIERPAEELNRLAPRSPPDALELISANTRAERENLTSEHYERTDRSIDAYTRDLTGSWRLR